MTFIISWLAIGFVLGCFNYFRAGSKEIGAIAELVAIMAVWPILGLIYIVVEVRRLLTKGEDHKGGKRA